MIIPCPEECRTQPVSWQVSHLAGWLNKFFISSLIARRSSFMPVFHAATFPLVMMYRNQR